MGKEIQFFMDAEDEREFVNFIYSNGDVLIMEKVREDGNIQIIKEPKELKYGKYFIYSPKIKFLLIESGFVSELESEVIEFSTTERKGNVFYPGRLWVEMKYWDENGNLVSKPLELDKKYMFYKKYITKSYRKSQNTAISYYIGPHAYDLYLKGEIKTMAGPVVEVKF